jgi:hypothetical protein
MPVRPHYYSPTVLDAFDSILYLRFGPTVKMLGEFNCGPYGCNIIDTYLV